MKISLTAGDAQSRSVLASCQRTVNLYAEANDPKLNEPSEVTHYPTPGLSLLTTSPNGKPIRGLYRATNGDLYCVANFDVYYIDPSWTFNHIGVMNQAVLNPVKMADNGINVIVCDGSSNGYSITMSTRSGLDPLFDPSKGDIETPSSTGWLGSNYADFSDTFFVANAPGTRNFYISNANSTIFDALQIQGKTANADLLIAAVVQHRVVWLIGTLSTEVWYDTGGDAFNPNFPFTPLQGVSIDWGCAAIYSISKAETTVLWLAQNSNGEAVVLQGVGYNVGRISTHALEYQLSTYTTVSDARGYAYMQNGHSFYVLTFPSADVTWVYDLATHQWHERSWAEPATGLDHRHRSDCHAFAYNTNVVNDWENGNLYSLDLNNFTDDGNPIKRMIRFPRQVDPDSFDRVLYKNFVADMDFGESLFPSDHPILTLRWSDDKGKTWSSGLEQEFGTTGLFSEYINYNRLGMARNRNYELSWASNCFTALNSATVDVMKAGT